MNFLSTMEIEITGEFIRKAIGIQIPEGYFGNQLGLVDDLSEGPGIELITFIDDEKYLKTVAYNKRIKSVFTNNKIWKQINNTKIKPIICEDPRYYFYSLYNYIAQSNYIKKLSVIASSAIIHNSANISDYNVVIGEKVEIGPNVTILPDVEIGDNSIIHAGSILGCYGFEIKRTLKGILSVIHDGKLIIGKNVQIGFNSTIYKGFKRNYTIIGNFTKIDNLVYIAHGVKIGEECFIIGNSMISGSSELGDRVWVGPSAVISNKLKIGSDAMISIGSVVTRDVKSNQKVTGNFAIDHEKFIEILKKNR